MELSVSAVEQACLDCLEREGREMNRKDTEWRFGNGRMGLWQI
jgi:hypothetical protein